MTECTCGLLNTPCDKWEGCYYCLQAGRKGCTFCSHKRSCHKDQGVDPLVPEENEKRKKKRKK